MQIVCTDDEVRLFCEQELANIGPYSQPEAVMSGWELFEQARAIDDEGAAPVLQSRLDDDGVAVGPVVAVPGEPPNALAVALDDQSVAIMLDFMEPVRTGGNGGAARG